MHGGLRLMMSTTRPRSHVAAGLNAAAGNVYPPSGGTDRKTTNIYHGLAPDLLRQVSHTLTDASRSTSNAEMLHTCGIRGDRGGRW
jgi:hypothetical protein